MGLHIPPGLARGVRLVLVVLLLAALAGATYQGVATALERRHFPYPGRMVPVGDHQLHIDCVGRGTPVVVLEAPVTGMSASWGLVQGEVAKVTRICSYDRAGLGWSEAGDAGYSPARVPDELHALLVNAKERAPYVVVGEGLGAAFARMYVSRYAHDAAALVAIDPPVPDGAVMPNARTTRLLDASAWLARVGILRATGVLSRHAAGLPPDSRGPMQAFLNRPDHLARSAEELERWDETMQLAEASPIAPHVLTAASTTDRRAAVDYLTNAADARHAAETIVAVVRRVRTDASNRTTN